MTSTTTDCIQCQRIQHAGLKIQCNTCRATRPNAQTLMHRDILNYMTANGCTAAEAEAHFGVAPVTI